MALILIGCILRLNHYFEGRSLWMDEAFVGMNIVHGTYQEFLRGVFFWPQQSRSPLSFPW